MRTLLFIALLIAMSDGAYFAQTIHSFNILSDGTDRNFIVYEPVAKPSPDKRVPLVICLHGYGDTNSNFQSFVYMNPVADTAGFYVAYPQALTNRAWNSGIGENPGFPTGTEDDVTFIRDMIHRIAREFSIDTSSIFCCGFSNGGFMSYKATCSLRGEIRAMASVGGLISAQTAATCSPDFPALMIHGDADDIVPIDGLPGWLGLDSAVNRFAEDAKPTFSVCRGRERIPSLVRTTTCDINRNLKPVRVMIMHGGNHNWPAPGYRCDIDASSEIWRFFRQFVGA
jgi:polyhydroxybutyrate depolymerase